MHILGKYVPDKSFLIVSMFWELLERIVSFKGVGVDYKPFLVFIESRYAFKSMFESFILSPRCLFDYVRNYLLVGKFGRLGARNELRN